MQESAISNLMSDNVTDNAVNSILDQLKQGYPTETPDPDIVPSPKPEELEQYIIDKSSDLINKSLQVLDEYRSFLTATPTEGSAEAMANLINASSSAIETLNKVLVTNKRADTAVKIKKMDIAAKVDNNKRDNATLLMMTRKDVMKMLMEPDVPIEVETTIVQS